MSTAGADKEISENINFLTCFMYIYKVIPLINIPRQHIQLPSYFSAQKFKPGQLVEVPVRSRKVPALIVTREAAEKKKQDIRKSSFKLRSIENPLVSGTLLPEKFLKLAARLADHYFSPLGLMLRRMLPPYFSKPTKPLIKMLSSLPEPPEFKKKEGGKKLLIIGDRKQRKAEYKKYIKEEGVLMLVPEFMQISVFEDIFPESAFAKIEGGLGRVESRNIWRDAYNGKLKNILGTRAALFTPFRNLKTIIIENENNTSHVSWDMHPKFDARHAAEIMAEMYGTDIVEGDIIPSIEKFHKARRENWEIIKKNPPGAKCKIIDMKKELEEENTSILSVELQEKIKALSKNEKMFLFMARRGLSSALVCRDCGHIVNCPDCDTPAILHTENADRNRLICHRCSKKMRAPDVCPECSGRRIKSLGGGTQLVAHELKKVAPELKIARIDSDVAKTPREQEKILKEFKDGDTNILVGTQTALKEYMLPEMERSAIVMMDAVLYLPEYRASEEVYNIVWRMKNIASKEVLIQTYHPELPVFTSANDNDIENFFEQELKKRKAFGWPPYSQIIKLNYSHRNQTTAEREAHAMKQKLETQIKDLEKSFEFSASDFGFQLLGPAPGYIPRVGGKYIWYILIKWPLDEKNGIKELQARNKLLNIVPPQWEIIVDPINLTD